MEEKDYIWTKQLMRMESIIERKYTIEEYFTFCEEHEGRFEFVNGEISEMSGESVTANQIAGNIHYFMRSALDDQPYILVQNAVKLQVSESRIFRIPDFLIFKEEGNKHRYATEPVLIVEVLSDSSAKTDRFTKLNEYKSIPSLLYYLIVDQETCYVEMHARDKNRWYVEVYNKTGQVINLPHFNVSLPLSKIYQRIFS